MELNTELIKESPFFKLGFIPGVLMDEERIQVLRAYLSQEEIIEILKVLTSIKNKDKDNKLLEVVVGLVMGISDAISLQLSPKSKMEVN